jgi:tRNA (guanine-N7-)-methyltransferase
MPNTDPITSHQPESPAKPADTKASSARPRPFRPEAVPLPRAPFPQELKGRTFICEIGSGTGRHAIGLAQSSPETPVVAIERTVNKSKKAINRFKSIENQTPHGLDNLFLIHDDAVHWLTHHIIQPCIQALYFLYPNPYPKESQKNKRFPHMPFMAHLSILTLPGAQLVMASNEPQYILDAWNRLPKWFGFAQLKFEVLNPTRPARTNFEQVFFDRGVLCYQATFQKVQ